MKDVLRTHVTKGRQRHSGKFGFIQAVLRVQVDKEETKIF